MAASYPEVGMWVRSSGPYWDRYAREFTGIVREVRVDAGLVIVDTNEGGTAANRWSLGSFWTLWLQAGWKSAVRVPFWLNAGRVLHIDENIPAFAPHSIGPMAIIEEVRGSWARLSQDGEFFGCYRAGDLAKWTSPLLDRFEREPAI